MTSSAIFNMFVYGIAEGYITALVVSCAEVVQRAGFRQVFIALLEPGRSDRAALKSTVFAKNSLSCTPDRDLGEPRGGAVFPLAIDDGTHGVTT
jgi:hypothetical protein